MGDPSNVTISPKTIAQLSQLGIEVKWETDAGCTFGSDIFTSPKGVLLLLVGGVLIGFGTRYAGGCIWSRHLV
jgi:hypothetical protein